MEVTINGISCVGTTEECAKFMNKMMNTVETLNESEEYVDLGLPSGKKWAKCNIGAEKETESGKYFQWGDIVGRTADEVKYKPCDWNTVPFGKKDFNSIKDMVCPNGVLAKEYDAAYINTYGKAHMPTKKDFKELINNTNITWEENFNGSGVNGKKFTSKKDPTKYIFIPSAGFSFYSSLNSRGSYGYVWSSSLYSRSTWELDFASHYLGIGNSDRFYGFSVRGVID